MPKYDHSYIDGVTSSSYTPSRAYRSHPWNSLRIYKETSTKMYTPFLIGFN